MTKLHAVVVCALLAMVSGCSDKPAASTAASAPTQHVLSEKTATIDKAREVSSTLGNAAALQRQAAEQSTQ